MSPRDDGAKSARTTSLGGTPAELAIVASLDQSALAKMFAASRREWNDEVRVGMRCNDIPLPSFADEEPIELPAFTPVGEILDDECVVVGWKLSRLSVLRELGVDVVDPDVPVEERGQLLYDDDMRFLGVLRTTG